MTIMIGLKGYHVKKHMVFYIIQENGRAFIARGIAMREIGQDNITDEQITIINTHLAQVDRDENSAAICRKVDGTQIPI